MAARRRSLVAFGAVLAPSFLLYTHSVVISGGSMLPTLHEEGDLVLVDPRSRWRPRYAKGDIVIATSPQNELVCKRVVATVRAVALARRCVC